MNKNSTIFLTGASGHIGAHLKDHFTSLGHEVIAPTRSECDLSVNGSTAKFIDTLLQSGKEIDYIICNAADQSVASLRDLEPLAVAKMLQINFTSVAEIFSVVASNPGIVESILTISSIEALTPRPGHLIYGASKAALESLSRSAAVEISPTRTNALRLGLISRPGIESSWPEGVSAWRQSTPLQRMGDVTDVSKAAQFLLESEWITGEVLTLDGGNSVKPGW